MKRFTVILTLVAFAAWAGTRAKDSDGSAPTTATSGVPLTDVVACRMSIRVDAGTQMNGTDKVDGDIAAGCKLIPSYYDAILGMWVEADNTLICTTAARLDGGRRTNYVCPDMVVAARYGRVAVHKMNCLGIDAGTGAALQNDAGAGPQPITRIECWGPKVGNGSSLVPNGSGQ